LNDRDVRFVPQAEIIVGVLFLRRPGEAVVTLTLLLIVFFMVEG
jgi:uncharacterized membrane protein HdeD (DUF308 family)